MDMYDAFLQAYPEFAATSRLDALRSLEYGRLDAHGHVYLDYTGGGLYADSQIRDHLALIGGQVFGNPHSKNLTSLAMGELVEQTRARVLSYFNASPDEYVANRARCNADDSPSGVRTNTAAAAASPKSTALSFWFGFNDREAISVLKTTTQR